MIETFPFPVHFPSCSVIHRDLNTVPPGEDFFLYPCFFYPLSFLWFSFPFLLVVLFSLYHPEMFFLLYLIKDLFSLAYPEIYFSIYFQIFFSLFWHKKYFLFPISRFIFSFSILRFVSPLFYPEICIPPFLSEIYFPFLFRALVSLFGLRFSFPFLSCSLFSLSHLYICFCFPIQKFIFPFQSLDLFSLSYPEVRAYFLSLS